MSAPDGAILETPRLVLREQRPGDLEFLAGLLGDPEVMRFYPHPLDREESRAWLDRQRARYARDGHGLWLAVERASGEPVGQVGLVEQHVDGRTDTEVGYMLRRECWGRGLATEAARACRDHAFTRLGRARVIALIRPVNLASRRVAERLGMRAVVRTQWAGLEHDVFAVKAQAARL